MSTAEAKPVSGSSSTAAPKSSSGARPSSSSSSSAQRGSDEGKKTKSQFQCDIVFGTTLPPLPFEPKLLRAPQTDEVAALYTAYTEDALDLAQAPVIHTDRFAGLALSAADINRYVWPEQLGARALDPLDAAIVDAGVLDEARRDPGGTQVPSMDIVAAAVKNAAETGVLSSTTTFVRVQMGPKPITIAEEGARAAATRDALRAGSLNFLNRAEYAEDKALSWAQEQKLREAKAAAKAAAAAAGNTVDSAVLAAEAEAASDAGKTPAECVAASFERVKVLPKHPTRPDLAPVEVLELVPDAAVCFSRRAPAGLVWVDFARADEVLVPPATAVTDAAAVRAAGAELMLAWTHDDAGKSALGGLGLYAPTDLATVAATAAARRKRSQIESTGDADADALSVYLVGDEEDQAEDDEAEAMMDQADAQRLRANKREAAKEGVRADKAVEQALAAGGSAAKRLRGATWLREMARAPVAELEKDDNYYLVFGPAAGAAQQGAVVVDAQGKCEPTGVVRYGRFRQRISLRKRNATTQDPCDRAIRSRPVHLVLEGSDLDSGANA